MKLVAAALVLLALGALGEVVDDFSTCSQFFRTKTPPKFNLKRPRDPPDSRYVKICQRYNNQYRYATLYDTEEKIPVFSAYKYEKKDDCKVDRSNPTWMIEPQIENMQNDKNMALQGNMQIRGKQAYNSDYENSRYDKGHLFPHCHAPDEETSISTFTLTNAAPQRCDFNRFWYNKVEAKVKNTLTTFLSMNKRSYVVTGVVPSTGTGHPTLKPGSTVNVPSHFWTGYCCCDNNDKQCQFEGFIMQREADDPVPYTVAADFNKELTNLYGKTIRVWDSC